MTTWPSAVLFDMDGTLIESHDNVERAWAAWAIARNLDPAAVIAMAHGVPADVTVAQWLPDASADEVADSAAELLALQYLDADGIYVIEGVHDLLRFLDETPVPWAVYTSADTDLARVRLQAAGLTPPVLVTRDQVVNGKPEPDGYLRAAQLLDVEPADCIVVEDTPAGIAAGRRAGMQTVGVRGIQGDLPIRSIPDLHLWLTVVHRPDDESAPAFPFLLG
ncbi:MAG: HAD family hydrolase [Candidatus Nanopelagicales bacterium]